MAVISAQLAGGIAVVHFLDLIAFSEGTSTSKQTKNDGYDVIVTGISGPEVFTNYSTHPFAPSTLYPNGRPAKLIKLATAEAPAVYSTASGRYQLLQSKANPYFLTYKKQLGLLDFSPLSQDRIGVQQIKECKAVDWILEGQLTLAINACSSRWASFPGNNYGQGGKTVETLVAKFNELQKGA